jgi:hypothetical protein
MIFNHLGGLLGSPVACSGRIEKADGHERDQSLQRTASLKENRYEPPSSLCRYCSIRRENHCSRSFGPRNRASYTGGAVHLPGRTTRASSGRRYIHCPGSHGLPAGRSIAPAKVVVRSTARDQHCGTVERPVQPDVDLGKPPHTCIVSWTVTAGGIVEPGSGEQGRMAGLVTAESSISNVQYTSTEPQSLGSL